MGRVDVHDPFLRLRRRFVLGLDRDAFRRPSFLLSPARSRFPLVERALDLARWIALVFGPRFVCIVGIRSELVRLLDRFRKDCGRDLPALVDVRIMGPSERHVSEEEDAEKLALGPDFEEANGLLNDEVRIVLEALVKTKTEEGREIPPLLERSLAYASRLGVYQNRPTLEAAREILQRAGMTGFQAGTIGNLTPGTVEEALVLVPSLRMNFPEETEEEREASHGALQNVLEGLERYKKHG